MASVRAAPISVPGMPERSTHDYYRHSITSLFAAFNIADGTVIRRPVRRAAPAVPRKITDADVERGIVTSGWCAGLVTRGSHGRPSRW